MKAVGSLNMAEIERELEGSRPVGMGLQDWMGRRKLLWKRLDQLVANPGPGRPPSFDRPPPSTA